MLTQEMVMTARDIVSKLDIPECFGCDSDGDIELDFLESQIDAVYSGNYHIENGISKMAIVFYDLPFVIKIPFNGHWQYDYAYNEETDEWEDIEEPYFNYFCRAYAYDMSDYCWNELDKVELAQERGYGELLADMISVYVDGNGRHFYIQEKVRPFHEARPFISKPSNDSLRKAQSLDKQYSSCNVEWRASVIEHYGEQFWISFVNWNDSGELGYLDDMHGGNYGFRYDGTPVLFDVAGYRDD